VVKSAATPGVWRENDVPVIAPQTAAQVPQTPAVSSSPCSALSLCRPLSWTLLLSHALFFFHLRAYLPCSEVDRCLAIPCVLGCWVPVGA
jgi:hypothetical protein